MKFLSLAVLSLILCVVAAQRRNNNLPDCPVSKRSNSKDYKTVPKATGCNCNLGGGFQTNYDAAYAALPTCRNPYPSQKYYLTAGCRCSNHSFETFMEDTGICISRAQCKFIGQWKAQCGENEQLLEGGCERYCEAPKNNQVKCDWPKFACRCAPGYYRTNDNRCVKQKECEQLGLWNSPDVRQCKSKKDEEIVKDITNKPQMCHNPGGNNEHYLDKITTCRCKSGYFRHRNGLCFRLAGCKYQDEIYGKCTGPNEEYKFQTYKHAATCVKPRPQGRRTTPTNRCECKYGFYRTPKPSDECVTKEVCKSKGWWNLAAYQG